MIYKNKKSRTAIPGYTLIPNGDHHQVRKISVTSERYKTDPAYHITRLHATEFGMAARFGKLMRAALLPGTGIKNKVGALTAVLLKALHTDTASPMGMRTFRNADFTSLIGFDCNQEAALGNCLSLNMEVELLPNEGSTITYLPAFIPAQAFAAPEGITHARIFTITVVINMAQYTFEKYTSRTTMMPLKHINVNGQTTAMKWPAEKDSLVIAALGIKWYQRGKAENSIVAGRVAGPLAILKVQRSSS